MNRIIIIGVTIATAAFVVVVVVVAVAAVAAAPWSNVRSVTLFADSIRPKIETGRY